MFKIQTNILLLSEFEVESLKKKSFLRSPKVSGELSILYASEINQAGATQHLPGCALEADL